MILTVGNTKGGVGKTTLAVQIAISRALAGRDVWLIDGDRQATAVAAIAARADAGRQPGIACAQYPDGPTLRSQVQQQREKWCDIIIDAGGRDSTALRAALILSDVLIVPFAPRSYDVWALDDMAALVDEARSVRDGLRASSFSIWPIRASHQPTTPRQPPLSPMCLNSPIFRPRSDAVRHSAMPAAQACRWRNCRPATRRLAPSWMH